MALEPVFINAGMSIFKPQDLLETNTETLRYHVDIGGTGGRLCCCMYFKVEIRHEARTTSDVIGPSMPYHASTFERVNLHNPKQNHSWRLEYEEVLILKCN